MLARRSEQRQRPLQIVEEALLVLVEVRVLCLEPFDLEYLLPVVEVQRGVDRVERAELGPI
jgi:hypothetical protein